MGPGRICRHCEKRSDEAIHNYRIHASDCFAEPVIGRRGACHRMRMRATRWLAMTISSSILLFSFPVMLQGRFAGANSDGQSSGNRLVNVTTPTTALKAQSTNHENDGEWLQTRPGERCLIRVSAAATNGAYSLVEIVADPGDGTPVRTVADWLHPR